MHGADRQAGDELDQVQPVGADVGDGAQLAAFSAQQAPVVVGRVEQPVLHIAAVDRVDAAQHAAPDQRAHFPVERVEAHIVVDPGRQPALTRQFAQRADSAEVIASGFSQWTCLPALSAALACEK